MLADYTAASSSSSSSSTTAAPSSSSFSSAAAAVSSSSSSLSLGARFNLPKSTLPAWIHAAASPYERPCLLHGPLELRHHNSGQAAVWRSAARRIPHWPPPATGRGGRREARVA
uniref:Uncharacterized protein n=1 Tax=Leersia perrieri TaxID=77586 RepID=A0A0D9WY75_9ORYZ